MTSNTQLRVAALLAAVLFSIGYLVVLVIPGGGEVTAKDFADYYDSVGRKRAALVLALVMIAAAWALVWFFEEVKARLADDALSRAASSVSLLGSGALAVGALIMLAPTGVALNSDADFVGVPIAHTLAQAGLGVMVFVGMWSLALATALVSVSAHRQALVPRWLSIGGVVASVLMIGSVIWMPGYVFPIWLAVFGLVGMRERAPER